MRKSALLALSLFASLSLPTYAAGTSIYKCGTSYSQLPCPGGEPIKADDIRSGAQKTQSDRAIASDRKLADNIAKNRIKQEKLDIAANTPPKTARANPAPTGETSAQSGDRKAKKPDWFVAQVPGAKNRKKNPGSTEVH